METSPPPLGLKVRKMAAAAQRLVFRSSFVARRITNYGRFYTENAPSRGLLYTTNLAEATVSLSSTRPLPVYRVMNSEGNVLDPQQDPNVRVNRCVIIEGVLKVLA